jgi:hypothetical protein
MVPLLVMVPRRSRTPVLASINPLLTTALVPVLTISVPSVASTVPAASLISVNRRSPVPSSPGPLMILFRLSSVSPGAVPVTTWLVSVPDPLLSTRASVPPPVSATVPLARNVAGALPLPSPATPITSRLVIVPRSVSVLPDCTATVPVFSNPLVGAAVTPAATALLPASVALPSALMNPLLAGSLVSSPFVTVSPSRSTTPVPAAIVPPALPTLACRSSTPPRSARNWPRLVSVPDATRKSPPVECIVPSLMMVPIVVSTSPASTATSAPVLTVIGFAEPSSVPPFDRTDPVPVVTIVPPLNRTPSSKAIPPAADRVAPVLTMLPRRSSVPPLVASSRPWLTRAMLPVFSTSALPPAVASIVPFASLVTVSEPSPMPTSP